MQRHNYPLKKYIKVIEEIAREQNFDDVKVIPNKGSTIRFELFAYDADVPASMWVIHHSHTRKKEVWSKENYRKAALHLNVSFDELMKRFY